MTPERSSDVGHGPATDDRLDSWKEIASYLKKGVRRVQRWEQNEGLPVRRLSSDRRGMVFAYRSEIDAWWVSRGESLSGTNGVERAEPDEGEASGEEVGEITPAADRGGWERSARSATVTIARRAIANIYPRERWSP